MSRDAFDIDALYVALDRKRRAERISWRELMRQAGFVGSALTTRLSRGCQMNTDSLALLLAWLGDTDVRPYITVKVSDD